MVTTNRKRILSSASEVGTAAKAVRVLSRYAAARDDGSDEDADGSDDDGCDVASSAGLEGESAEEDITDDSADSDTSAFTDHAQPFRELGDDIVADSDKVGNWSAELISRDRIRNTFWASMERRSVETSYLACDLFDRYGRLSREYITHPVKRGTGVWGPELDYGNLLFVKNIEVDKGWRRQRLGTLAVQQALKTKGWAFALFTPSCCIGTRDWKKQDKPKKDWVHPTRVAISERFWRSLGFRRVGTSAWFALAKDPDHPSRQLPARCDAKTHRPSWNKQPLPRICPRNSMDPAWLSTDEQGNTRLHKAVSFSERHPLDLRLVRKIVSTKPELTNMRNLEGNTPLEELQSLMEWHRTCHVEISGGYTRMVSDEFRGFDLDKVQCVSVLSWLKIFSNGATFDVPLDVQYGNPRSPGGEETRPSSELAAMHRELRIRYGCTCGDCIGGFLSPRMRLALSSVAEAQCDMRNKRQRQNHLGDSVESQENSPTSPHGRHEPRGNAERSLNTICQRTVKCLGRRIIPTPANVLAAFGMESADEEMSDAGPTPEREDVERAINMLFKRVKKRNEFTGDRSFQRKHAEQIKKLPECRNDEEFGFVSAMCLPKA